MYRKDVTMLNQKFLKKKTFTLFLVLILALSLAGCGTKSSTGGQQATDTNSSQTPETTEDVTPDTQNTPSQEETEEPTNSPVSKEVKKQASIQTKKPVKGDTIVTITFKDFGDVKIKMFPKEAPKAVENFTTHAKKGYYNGLTMHRVIADFMIQGGDPSGDGTGGESIWGSEFENETVEYLNPIRGSLCMANAGPDTNGSQFFITQASTIDESLLDGLTNIQKEMYRQYGGCPWLTGGYTVFGQVYEGMDVVDAISKVETASNDAPLENVIIEKIKVSTFKQNNSGNAFMSKTIQEEEMKLVFQEDGEK